MAIEEIKIQRAYYANTAEDYDAMHPDEHGLGLQFMIAVMDELGVRSVLDLGCGTGRALLKIQEKMTGIHMVGIEPSAELRSMGHSKGIPETQLIDGDAMHLPYPDGAFDLVCEFGMLHHIPHPSKAVAEMLRVARKAIFISDCNNFGQGGLLARLIKQSIHAVGLWSVADLIKTRGKGYTISEGDGLFYSYSVFNDYNQIARQCEAVHMLNSNHSKANLYRTASHVTLLGIKR